MEERICVIGGSNIDICGASIEPLRNFDSNPGIVTVRYGGVGRNIDDTDLTSLPRVVGIGTVEHHMDAEGAMTSGSETEVECRAIAFGGASECLHAFGVLGQTSEAEILESHHPFVGDAGKVHAVVPVVVIILHPVVTRHVASQTGRIVLIRRKTEDLEALRGDLGARIASAVGSRCRPLIVLDKGVVSHDAHHSTVGHRFLVADDFHGCHHGLAGIAKPAWRTMVEHIPLTIDFLQRTMGVVCRIGSGEVRAILIGYHTARVDQHAT